MSAHLAIFFAGAVVGGIVAAAAFVAWAYRAMRPLTTELEAADAADRLVIVTILAIAVLFIVGVVA